MSATAFRCRRREAANCGARRDDVGLIYKICPAPLWREAERSGRFTGSPADLADGFIHFSTAKQAVETAARHYRRNAISFWSLWTPRRWVRF